MTPTLTLDAGVIFPAIGLGELQSAPEETAAAVAEALRVRYRHIFQQGRPVIPQCTNPARSAENVDVFDFELSSDDLDRVDALDTAVRGGPGPDRPRAAFYDRVVDEA